MRRRGFTLIEILLALFAGAIILAAIYGFFAKAVHMRRDALERARDTRLRSRAADTLRRDLRGAIVTGGLLAPLLQGSAQAPSSSFPGYLKFATTTGRDDVDQPGGDVQQVEYFIATDPAAGDNRTGTLVRTLNRDPLAPLATDLPQEAVLGGVSAMEVTFWDGTTWQDSWQYGPTDTAGTAGTPPASTASGTGNTTLPEAVKVVIRQPAPNPPIEVEVPWGIQPEVEPSPAASPAL